MSTKKPDISQLRKYLEGELDAHAMHQLERQAQDDPFLMDAMEGYEEAGLDQQAINDLDARLQQRIDQTKQRRIILWRYISAAASVILICCIAYLLWPGTKAPDAQKERLANIAQPPPTDHPVVKTDTAKPPVVEKPLLAEAVHKAAKKEASVQVAAAPDKAVSSSEALAPVSPVNALAKNDAIRIDEPVGNSDVKMAVATAANHELSGKVAGLQTTQSSGYINIRGRADTTNKSFAKMASMQQPKDSANYKSNYLKEVTVAGRGALTRNTVGTTPPAPQVLQGYVEGAKVDPPPSHTISGVVRDDRGMPLPGASILVNGTNLKTQTDYTGRFSLTTPTTSNTLAVNFIGFESKEVQTREDVKDLNINLKPTESSLNEVVVVGYGAVKPIKQAHPLMGWDAYNKYLKYRAIAADGKTGTVELSFTVGEKGMLSDFKVMEGLSDATNQQAIDLVKSGPKWAPDVDGKPKTVKLKIRFEKAKN